MTSERPPRRPEERTPLSSNPHEGDAALMRAVAAGDRAAFRAVYDAHHAAVLRVACGVLLDADEAGDVAQEVFVRAHRAAGRWRPDASLRTWLYRVTLNEALGVRRRLRRFRRWLTDDAAPPTGAPSPEGELARRETLDAVRAALSELGARQRAVLTLHLDGDLAPAEIAGVLEMTPNAVRVALHHGIARLREQARARGLEFPADDAAGAPGAAPEEDAR